MVIEPSVYTREVDTHKLDRASKTVLKGHSAGGGDIGSAMLSRAVHGARTVS